MVPTNIPIAGISNSEKRMRLFQRVDQLERLAPGWDSYDGRPLDPNVAAKIIELGLTLIPRETVFYITPNSDGSAQIEWRRNGLDVEIRVRVSGTGE